MNKLPIYLYILKISLALICSILVLGIQVYAQGVGPAGVDACLNARFDSSDIDGDFDETDNPVDGSLVTTWVDKSGNGNDATVLLGKNAAEVESDAGELINGHPVLKFNKISQNEGSVYTTPVDIRAGSMEDLTMFLVYKPKSLVDRQSPWGIDNGSRDRFFYSYLSPFGDGVDDGVVGLGPLNNGSVVRDSGKIDNVYLQSIIYDGEVVGGSNNGPINGSEVYLNGNLLQTFTDSTHPTNAVTNMAIGWDGDGGTYDGQIAEMITYDCKLSTCDFAKVNRYLGEKYGEDFDGTTLTIDTLFTGRVLETDPIGTAVGDLYLLGAAFTGVQTYTLIGGEGDDDNSSFTLSGNQLILQTVADFEIPNDADTDGVYTIRVQTMDGCLSYENTLQIVIQDVIECGNGILDIYEECDDTNAVSGDGCSGTDQIFDNQCKIEYCRDNAPITDTSKNLAITALSPTVVSGTSTQPNSKVAICFEDSTGSRDIVYTSTDAVGGFTYLPALTTYTHNRLNIGVMLHDENNIDIDHHALVIGN